MHLQKDWRGRENWRKGWKEGGFRAQQRGCGVCLIKPHKCLQRFLILLLYYWYWERRRRSSTSLLSGGGNESVLLLHYDASWHLLNYLAKGEQKLLYSTSLLLLASCSSPVFSTPQQLFYLSLYMFLKNSYMYILIRIWGWAECQSQRQNATPQNFLSDLFAGCTSCPQTTASTCLTLHPKSFCLAEICPWTMLMHLTSLDTVKGVCEKASLLCSQIICHIHFCLLPSTAVTRDTWKAAQKWIWPLGWIKSSTHRI